MPKAKLINKNLSHLVDSLDEGKSGATLEGGSRSGKTWSGVDFILYLATTKDPSAVVNIIKETFQSFKTTLYDDFKRRLDPLGVETPFSNNVKNVQTFNIFDVKVNFMGADKPSKIHGAGCDYLWCNEVLDIDNDIYDQAEQRTRKFVWNDYNPKLTQHWYYDKVCTRPDFAYLKTTLLDNPYISEKEKAKILSYEPTPQNIDNGTADDYKWKVYGLGERMAQEGLIFKYIEWIEQFPEIDYWYGLDFGFTNDPTCLVRFTQEGRNIYIEPLIYEPVVNSDKLHHMFEALGVEKDKPIISDSSDKYISEYGSVEMVRDLKQRNWQISKVHKRKTVEYGISNMQEYKINIIKNGLYRHAKKEADNYAWASVNGIKINKPIDDFNHMWDATRYAFQADRIFTI